MMNVYDLRVDTEGEAAFFSALRPKDFAVLAKEFRGEVYRGPWSPMPIERSRDRGNKRRPLADFTDINAQPILVFSARARQVLAPHLDRLGQWFELQCAEAPYFIFNLTRVIDALDSDRAVLSYFFEDVESKAELLKRLELLRADLEAGNLFLPRRQ